MDLSNRSRRRNCLFRVMTRLHGGGQRNRGSIPGRGRVFLFSRAAVGPTKFRIYWVLLGLLCQVKASASSHRVPRLRMDGDVPSLPHIPSDCGA